MSALYPDAPDLADVAFSNAARQLLAGARAEADRLRHEYIGTEHMVLAMTHDTEASALLARWGLGPDAVRASVDAVIVPGHGTPTPAAELPYTSRTRQAVGLAVESARSQGCGAVGIDHIVVGLLRERLNLGAQVLQQHGLTVERATAEVGNRRGGERA